MSEDLLLKPIPSSPSTDQEMLQIAQEGLSHLGAFESCIGNLNFQASDAALAEYNRILTEVRMEIGEQEKTGTFLRVLRTVPGFGRAERKFFDLESVSKKKEGIKESIEQALSNVRANIEPLEGVVIKIDELIPDIARRISQLERFLETHPDSQMFLYFQNLFASLSAGLLKLEKDKEHLEIDIATRRAYLVKMQAEWPILSASFLVSAITEQSAAESEQAILASRAVMKLNDELARHQMKTTERIVDATTELLATHPLSLGTMEEMITSGDALRQKLKNRASLLQQRNEEVLSLTRRVRANMEKGIPEVGYLPSKNKNK